jgi:hypothetical protein
MQNKLPKNQQALMAKFMEIKAGKLGPTGAMERFIKGMRIASGLTQEYAIDTGVPELGLVKEEAIDPNDHDFSDKELAVLKEILASMKK